MKNEVAYRGFVICHCLRTEKTKGWLILMVDSKYRTPIRWESTLQEAKDRIDSDYDAKHWIPLDGTAA